MACYCDGYPFKLHRIGSLKCKFTKSGEYRDGPIEDMPGIFIEF